MVFSGIYLRLNDLEKKVEILSSGSSPGVISSSDSACVDLSDVNTKISILETKIDSKANVSDLPSLNDVNDKVGLLQEKLNTLPKSYVDPSEFGNLLEKLNQITNILAQFSAQINSIADRVAQLESSSATNNIESNV